MNSAAELVPTAEKLDSSFDMLADYTYRVSSVRDEIRITEGEISQIALDVNGLTGKEVDLEDFIEWERKLEDELTSCHELIWKIFRIGESSSELPMAIQDYTKVDLVAIWMIEQILQMIHKLIDNFLVLTSGPCKVEPQTPTLLELYTEITDIDEEILDTPGAAEKIAIDRLTDKFRRLHEMADEIEDEMTLKKCHLLA